jgi:hypothetical protein
MSPLLVQLSSNFLPRFLAGMMVNFEIAAIAIVLGVGVGLVLAAARLSGGIGGRAAATTIALMRAAPTFVVMFFLLNVIPRDARFFGAPLAMSGLMTVALSLVPYAAAYIADNGIEAWRQWRGGSPRGCLLLLPNLARAFFVLVMSSSAGAAIGVNEGIAVILHHSEQLPGLGDKLVLFAIGILCFGVPLQAGFAALGFVQRRIGRLALRGREEPAFRPT